MRGSIRALISNNPPLSGCSTILSSSKNLEPRRLELIEIHRWKIVHFQAFNQRVAGVRSKYLQLSINSASWEWWARWFARATFGDLPLTPQLLASSYLHDTFALKYFSNCSRRVTSLLFSRLWLILRSSRFWAFADMPLWLIYRENEINKLSILQKYCCSNAKK